MTVIEASRPTAERPASRPTAERPAPPTTAENRNALTPRLRPALLRRGRLVALVVGCFLLPWCVLLFVTLPATAHAEHWSLAWTGLDAAEAAAALATATLLTRSDPRASLTAAAGGAFLLTDAWLDVCTSAPGLDQCLAVGEAIFVELPLAAAAFWLAAHVSGFLLSGECRTKVNR